MSDWDPYVDKMIEDSATTTEEGGKPTKIYHVDRACVIGIKDKRRWSTDGHKFSFNMSPEECAAIVLEMGLQEPKNFQERGVMAAGQKYTFLSCTFDDNGKINSIKAKCTGKGSIFIERSAQLMLAVHVKDGCQLGMGGASVLKCMTHLKNSGY